MSQHQECIAMLLAGGQGSRLGLPCALELTLPGLSVMYLEKVEK